MDASEGSRLPRGGSLGVGDSRLPEDLGSITLDDATGALLQSFPRPFSAPMWKLHLKPDLLSQNSVGGSKRGRSWAVDSTVCRLDRGTGEAGPSVRG